MPTEKEISKWEKTLRTRYLNYLKTSFYFKDADLRESFKNELDKQKLTKGPFPEPANRFKQGINTYELAKEFFDRPDGILPALLNRSLYSHQEQATRLVHNQQENVVVATGTASGKTESFLYPILFDLYQQHLDGKLTEPGVRALVLYPMNALANDQRRRLGEICRYLKEANSDFKPTFGQYTGATPENEKDKRRYTAKHEGPGELIFREQMRNNPPHILLTNYSMLEYLLIRPADSPLFDGDRGRHWKFIVLDEAHQYRGTRGMEMGMLVRRLKQRLRAGGREDAFRCIATSATISSGDGPEDREAVAAFAKTLFEEPFNDTNVILGKQEAAAGDITPQRFHFFMSALEGAFLAHQNGKDKVILNRNTEAGVEEKIAALEIALCKECGQHYYVGREVGGKLIEAIRDPSHSDFGVDFYLPLDNNMDKKSTHTLCRKCGKLSEGNFWQSCGCDASISVKKCTHPKEDRQDQLKKCEVCEYARGGIGDPVQEIVHGSDGPNSVIVTALHGLLKTNDRRKILAFADNRQEAAFFAWYAADSYNKVRDRNFILRALKQKTIDKEGLSIKSLQNRLQKEFNAAGLFELSKTAEDKKRETMDTICRELLTLEKRISLNGVGLVKWFVKIPPGLQLPETIFMAPWNFTQSEGWNLLGFLLDNLRQLQAIKLPSDASSEDKVFEWSQATVRFGNGAQNIRSWGGDQTHIVKFFLPRLLPNGALSNKQQKQHVKELMRDLWDSITSAIHNNEKVLVNGRDNGTFLLNPAWLRITLPSLEECFECNICASLSFYNIREVCPRSKCQGNLVKVNKTKLEQNHYRVLYEDTSMPVQLRSMEHTAQLQNEEAQKRQTDFINGDIDLLSSSTTFEIGVDLGDLETVFLRNVPPEPFNYTQRVGRAGRRGDMPGFALTYCCRRPHDLYHYAEPMERILKGKVHPPQLRLQNKKIIIRHITAVALAEFFRTANNAERLKEVIDLIGGDWENPRAVTDFQSFCQNNGGLVASLRAIVPTNMHEQTGLNNGSWVDRIAGEKSRFDAAEKEICSDYRQMEKLEKESREGRDYRKASGFQNRANTIAHENSLDFLSRKAIIPKYGFPVDVVELDTRPSTGEARKISLQRDLSQAIAEYAPKSKIVANKQEWESCGIKIIRGKELTTKNYSYDEARDFREWLSDTESPNNIKPKGKYLSPQFGFVTALDKKVKEPQGRAGRLYTTRPFFKGFVHELHSSKEYFGIKITPASPGRMVVLCEGKNGSGFYICLSCGAGFTERQESHRAPEGYPCSDTLKQFALGHEFVTDVVRLQFPGLIGQQASYSLAYAVLLGAAQRLDVPSTDLNVTITAGNNPDETAIVLYDNVPGGAGLVASLEKSEVFRSVLEEAKERVDGNCGCTESCYGCLRNYRNQFTHPDLQRKVALEILDRALSEDFITA